MLFLFYSSFTPVSFLMYAIPFNSIDAIDTVIPISTSAYTMIPSSLVHSYSIRSIIPNQGSYARAAIPKA